MQVFRYKNGKFASHNTEGAAPKKQRCTPTATQSKLPMDAGAFGASAPNALLQATSQSELPYAVGAPESSGENLWPPLKSYSPGTLTNVNLSTQGHYIPSS